MASPRGFSLGDQPEWTGVEPCVALTAAEQRTLLCGEDVEEQLVSRGYAVVPVHEATQNLFSAFLSDFEAFSAMPLEDKHPFAVTQFDPAKHSPNQLHGFSRIDGLKEQFMVTT